MGFARFQERLRKAKAAGEPLSDFRNFMAMCFRHIPGSPKPTAMQYDFGHSITTGPDRMLHQVFRGFGKSTIVGMIPPWAWTLDPDMKFMVVSGEAGLAAQMTTFILNLLREEPKLQHLYPGPKQRSSAIAFDVRGAKPHRDFGIRSVGVLGRMTGGHADWILPDDVEVPNTSDTVGMREKLRARYEELEAIVNAGGRVTPIGTPQTDETLYNVLVEQGYETLVYPARAPGGEYAPLERYGERLAPFVAERLEDGRLRPDDPTDPDRLDEEDLVSKETRYRRRGFQLQYMLDPSLADQANRPLRLNDWIVADLDAEGSKETVRWASGPSQVRQDVPCLGTWNDHYHRPLLQEGEWKPWAGTVMWIDPAGTGADDTAYAVVSVLNGQLFLRDWGGRREDGTSDTTMEWLAAAAKRNRVNEVLVEGNWGDGMYAKLLGPVLRRVHPCRLESIKNTGKKADRIVGTLEPVMRRHRLIVDARKLQEEAQRARDSADTDASARTLAWQTARMTHDGKGLPYDDVLEAVACAAKHFADALDRDNDPMSDEESLREEEEWMDEGCPILEEPDTPVRTSFYSLRATRARR